MNREEAIRIIKIVLAVAEDFEITVQGVEFTKEKCKEAVEIAIKALEQEPKLLQALEQEKGAYNALVKNIQCSDAISREMALKECHDIVIDGERYRVIQEETLLGLPLVNPQSKTDVLDKIRAEIQTTIREEKTGNGNINKGVVIGLQMALDVIDKYKAESEGIKK